MFCRQLFLFLLSLQVLSLLLHELLLLQHELFLGALWGRGRGEEVVVCVVGIVGDGRGSLGLPLFHG